MHSAYVAIGSNLGTRALHLQAALDGLAREPKLEIVTASSVYETEPVGGPPQGSFLNAVLQLQTSLSAPELLERLLLEEACGGRTRGPVRDVARTIDLDLLLFDDQQLESPRLTLPHPRMHERAFVLVPLAEIAPDVLHPGSGRSAKQLLRSLGEAAGVRRLERPVLRCRRTR